MRNSTYMCMVFLMLLAQLAHAQVNRYFVYFSDKSGVDYPYSVDAPSAFLTQEAIDRRNTQGIAVDHSDLPVDPSYVQGIKDAGADVYFTSRWLNGALINLDASLTTTLEALAYVTEVRLIASGTRLSHDQNVPEDPVSFEDPPFVLGNSTDQLAMLGADQMHEDGYQGQGMRIAVLDNGFTGVNAFSPFEHLWTNDRIIATKDFVTNSGDVYQLGEHGTAVFSIISANYTSSEGVMKGAAYEAEFILCVTEDNHAENILEEYNWLLGAEFADSLGADIINGSLGYLTFDISAHDYTYDDLDGRTAISSLAAQFAARKGMVVVVSAGNEGNDPWGFIIPPADADSILTVGSVNPDLSYTVFSSRGNTSDGRIKPDIAALGLSTSHVNGAGAITKGNGTSYASPLIAGFTAGIWQKNPNWSRGEVIEAIKNSGHMNQSPDSLRGWGVPNYTHASEGTIALLVDEAFEIKVTAYPNPFDGSSLFLKTTGSLEDDLQVRLFDSQGRLIINEVYAKESLQETIELKVEGRQQGVYFLFLQTGTLQKTIKLVNY